MGRIHLVTDIQAPVARCFDLCRSVDVHLDSAGDTGERIVAGASTGLLSAGDTVTFEGRHFGVRLRLKSEIVQMDPPVSFTDRQVSGPFAEFEHRHHFEAANGGTRMHDEISLRCPLGVLGGLADPVITAHLRRFIATRNQVIKRIAEGDGWQGYAP